MTANASTSPARSEDSKNSPQEETQRPKSLLDLLFHRNTKVSANSTNIAPAQTPPSSSKTQSENEASPQNQQGTAASLPAPDANAATPAPSRSNAAASASSATAPQSTAEIPAADLATLYNYVQDCRACQLQLTAAKQNASDDASKIRALTRERDAAITATKGGPFWLRLKRNAHWLAIGAAIGAVTSTATLCHTGHCR